MIGKPVGIMVAARIATSLRLATRPDASSWSQLWGAVALGGMGFTMSLFIASAAFPDQADYAAPKVAIFLASLLAATAGVAILWRSAEPDPG